VELARAVSLKHSLDVGVYRAVRYLSIVPSDQATATQMIRDEVNNNVLGGNYGSQVNVTINMPSQAFGTVFTVQATLNYQAVVPFTPLGARNLTISHSQAIEKYP